MTAPPPRKIAIYPNVGPLEPTITVDHVRKPNDANTYVASGQNLPAETAARIAADAALSAAISDETNARVAGDNTLSGEITAEATTRANADTAETNARVAADNTLSGEITTEATTRANADTAEANARVAGDTAAMFATFNLSGLPTTNPGGGRPWLSGGNIHVGP